MENIFFGGLAGIFSKTLTTPIERLKTLRQNKLDDLNYRKGGALRYIFKHEGIRGLFKGNIINCIRTFPQTATQYGTYQLAKNMLPIKNKTILDMSSGALAGLTSMTVVYPIELVRTRYIMQTQINKPIIHNLSSGLKHIYEGDKKFYRGWKSSVLRVAPLLALNFTFYNKLNDLNKNNNKLISCLCGSISGILSLSLWYPPEIWNRRMQLQNFYKDYPVYKNIPDVIKQMYKNEGFKSFYIGLGTAIQRIALSNGLYFMFIEILRDMYNTLKNEN